MAEAVMKLYIVQLVLLFTEREKKRKCTLFKNMCSSDEHYTFLIHSMLCKSFIATYQLLINIRLFKRDKHRRAQLVFLRVSAEFAWLCVFSHLFTSGSAHHVLR